MELSKVVYYWCNIDPEYVSPYYLVKNENVFSILYVPETCSAEFHKGKWHYCTIIDDYPLIEPGYTYHE
jgi:hypothetical protein